jgi:hypothetical protein
VIYKIFLPFLLYMILEYDQLIKSSRTKKLGTLNTIKHESIICLGILSKSLNYKYLIKIIKGLK